MGRARKPLSEQKGHLTQETQVLLTDAEAKVSGTKRVIFRPPKFLIDDVAKKEYSRLVKLLKEIDIIGDIDVNNIAMYCNAFSKYCDATEQLGEQGITIVNADGVTMENPLVNTQRKYAEECRKFAATCGLTLDSRLKAGQAKVDKTNREIEDLFGDI